ncbi:MAG: hypothetical protein WA860_10345 [Acidimicrobiales bacterium]
MRGRYRVVTASLLCASLSLGAVALGASGAGASSTKAKSTTTATTTSSAATSSSSLGGLSSIVSSLLPSLPALPSLPTLSSIPPLCTELSGTPVCGTASTLAVMQELSSIQNWIQEFSTAAVAKVPAT